jgi:hypothetical protein
MSSRYLPDRRDSFVLNLPIYIADGAFRYGNFERGVLGSEFEPGTKFVAYNRNKWGVLLDVLDAKRVGFPTSDLAEAMQSALDVVKARQSPEARQAGIKVHPRSVFVSEITPEGNEITLWSCFGDEDLAATPAKGGKKRSRNV